MSTPARIKYTAPFRHSPHLRQFNPGMWEAEVRSGAAVRWFHVERCTSLGYPEWWSARLCLPPFPEGPGFVERACAWTARGRAPGGTREWRARGFGRTRGEACEAWLTAARIGRRWCGRPPFDPRGPEQTSEYDV